MPLGYQAINARPRHALEIEVEPGVADVGQAAPQCDEGNLALGQIVDPVIVPLGSGDDERIDKAPRHHALQIGIGIFLGRA